MTDTNENQAEMTKAQAAKLVKRTVPVLDKGKATGKFKSVAVKTDEVLDFKVYSDHVVVVTTDGQKLKGDLA
ncbi:MAG: hypothetical protein AB2604_10600 [Candidatus Thiodiazotropha taylori]